MYCWESYCFISSFRMKLPARFCALKQRTSDPSDLRLLMPIADKSWDWMRWWGRTQWFSHAPHDRFLFFFFSFFVAWTNGDMCQYCISTCFLNMITKKKHLFNMKIVSILPSSGEFFLQVYRYVIQRDLPIDLHGHSIDPSCSKRISEAWMLPFLFATGGIPHRAHAASRRRIWTCWTWPYFHVLQPTVYIFI